jgi:hypothetical protein
MSRAVRVRAAFLRASLQGFTGAGRLVYGLATLKLQF